jgi:hypothetical protein
MAAATGKAKLTEVGRSVASSWPIAPIRRRLAEQTVHTLALFARTHCSFAAALILAAALREAVPAAMAAPVADPEQRNSFVYEPPSQRPQDKRSQQFVAPANWLLDRMAKHLREFGMQVEWAASSNHTLVALYSGDPREFVDCGLVRMMLNGERSQPAQQYSANRPETRTYRFFRGRRIGLLREMRLDARLTVEVRQDKRDEGVQVTTKAIYVLSKMISRMYKGGEAGPVVEREVISFVSGEVGRFQKGTSCVATGRLEDLPVLPFKKSTRQ